jgi:uncharacterized protein YjbI with pentapeptide repeats
MTRDESIALWRECEEIRIAWLAEGKSEYGVCDSAASKWNTWAEAMLSDRKKLDLKGLWQTRGERLSEANNDETAEWIKLASVDFSDLIFVTSDMRTRYEVPKNDQEQSRLITTGGSAAHFIGYVFPWLVDFSRSRFVGRAWFTLAKFRGPTWFGRTIFEGPAWFEGGEFSRETFFGSAIFRDTSSFEKAKFSSSDGDIGASFFGINSERAFNLSGASFELLPDLRQANCKQAPDLDDVYFPIPSLFGKRSTADANVKFRAIRRLAIQGHDHENEARAFKGEVRAKRGSQHKWYHAPFWVGILYDTLCDFGVSIMRPFLLWLVSIPLFTSIYLEQANKFATALLSCSDGTPIWEKALVFSLKNSVLFVSWDREQIRSAYACLYYKVPSNTELIVPTSSAFIQAFQSIWSAILIFLFLLAVRNNFKIK